MIAFGLLFGRWWRLALVLAAFAWPLLLVVDDAMGIEPGLLGAAALGLANAGAGVLAHQLVLRLVRRLRQEEAPVP